jgi:transcriptional regulator with XRE-family HTH domain
VKKTTKSTIGQRIRAARLRARKSQVELAAAITGAGIPYDQSNVSALERDRRETLDRQVRLLRAIAEATDCEVADLIG